MKNNGKEWRNKRKEKCGMIPYKPISNRLTDDGYEGLSDSEKMIITEQMRYMSDMEKLFRVSVWRRLKDKIIKLFKI